MYFNGVISSMLVNNAYLFNADTDLGAECPRNSHGVAHKRSLPPYCVTPIPDLRSNLSEYGPGFKGTKRLSKVLGIAASVLSPFFVRHLALNWHFHGKCVAGNWQGRADNDDLSLAPNFPDTSGFSWRYFDAPFFATFLPLEKQKPNLCAIGHTHVLSSHESCPNDRVHLPPRNRCTAFCSRCLHECGRP